MLPIVTYAVGDEVAFEFTSGESTCTVTSVGGTVVRTEDGAQAPGEAQPQGENVRAAGKRGAFHRGERPAGVSLRWVLATLPPCGIADQKGNEPGMVPRLVFRAYACWTACRYASGVTGAPLKTRIMMVASWAREQSSCGARAVVPVGLFDAVDDACCHCPCHAFMRPIGQSGLVGERGKVGSSCDVLSTLLFPAHHDDCCLFAREHVVRTEQAGVTRSPSNRPFGVCPSNGPARTSRLRSRQ